MGKKQIKLTSIFLLIIILAQIIGQIPIISTPEVHAEADTPEWAFYSEKLDAKDIELSGDAYIEDDKVNDQRNIILTESEYDQAGAAFSKVKIKEKDGFSTFFKLDTSHHSTFQADGFCIILAKDRNVVSYDGLIGKHLGYGNIGASIGIEIDMFQNSDAGAIEMDIPHMYLWKRKGDTVLVDGSAINTTGTKLERDLVMEGEFYVWVEYSSTNHSVKVYISKSKNKPTIPTATYNEDLSTVIGDEYFIGISASTGAGRQRHYVKAWGITNTSTYRKAATLTVNPNEGIWENSGNIQNIVLDVGATRNIPVPTRTGYRFTGWTLTRNRKYNEFTNSRCNIHNGNGKCNTNSQLGKIIYINSRSVWRKVE